MEEKDLITQANQAAERLEKANKEMNALLERQERNRSIDIISGKSEVSPLEKVLTPEEKLMIDMKSMFKGTVVENALK